MTIVFPGWYEGGFPDAELVAMDLAQTFLDMLTPQGLAVQWLTADHTALVESGTPVVRVYRGGMAMASGLFDPSAVQFGVIARTRSDSWAVLEYLRQMLLSYEHGGDVRREDGSITHLASAEEIQGPQMLPGLNPDHRLVPMTFRLLMRRPPNLPDYAVIRESLSL
ncbi:phage tail termination protein [Nocardia puris]|uniref:Tail terminator n=1 Tax=Nocardia puris TaxID=208602 RepID=A0A366DAI2_9NOCA|nr:hypothetical protein [Nocardia puris]RBO87026.1 hypothetical protein DFR74_112203 [Nocardia puris]